MKKKEQDRLTISFCAPELKEPMNQLIDSWKQQGFKVSSKAALSLIQMNHLDQSTQFGIVSNIYHYIYQSLVKVYGERTPELYKAIDDVMVQVITINGAAMVAAIQEKITEGLQAASVEPINLAHSTVRPIDISPIPQSQPVPDYPAITSQALKDQQRAHEEEQERLRLAAERAAQEEQERRRALQQLEEEYKQKIEQLNQSQIADTPKDTPSTFGSTHYNQNYQGGEVQANAADFASDFENLLKSNLV